MKEFLVQVPASTGAAISYLPVASNHVLTGGYVVLNANAADAELVISFISGSTTVATATIPDTTAVATPVAIVMNTTLATRKTNFTTAAPVIVSTDGAQTGSIGFDVLVQLDEFAIPRD